ncbi:MAG: UvrD-helicase domain-containing protein [Myxococcales bacterium]
MDLLPIAKRLDTDFQATCARLDDDEPYLGSFTLVSNSKPVTYKVGSRKRLEERILDWRHPLARAYYTVTPGEDFELDEPGFAHVQGVLDQRCALTAQARRLRCIEFTTTDGKQLLVAGDNGFERLHSLRRPPFHEGGLGDLRALLTTTQYELITRSRSQPLIIQGRAGSGKTSVAMHRVAWLAYAAEDTDYVPVDPSRVLVVMFNKALSSFVRTTLAPLGLNKVQLDTFHGWALTAIHRGYRGVVRPDTERRSHENKAQTLKKHVGMLSAIDEMIARQTGAVGRWLHEKLAPHKSVGAVWLGKWSGTKGPVMRRLVSLRREALAARDAARGVEVRHLTELHKILTGAVTRMSLYKEDLLSLLTNEELLTDHLTGVSRADIEALVSFQRDVAALGGTERRPGPGVRFEDFALLLRIMQRKNGGLPDKSEEEVYVYDHLVLDEAQDFGAVELAVILGAVQSRTGVTIVGDVNQKIVPSVEFMGWDGIAGELGIEGADVTRLEVAHRSTCPIMTLADGIVGDRSMAGRDGPLPVFFHVADNVQVFDVLEARIRSTLESNPKAHVCVVTREPSEVQSLLDGLTSRLRPPIAVRKGHNAEFIFAPGVTVTNFLQVKGLEFDALLVVEPTEAKWPDTQQGRRNFYTLITRARDTLDFISIGNPCSILAKALEEGLVVSEDPVPTAPADDLDTSFPLR